MYKIILICLFPLSLFSQTELQKLYLEANQICNNDEEAIFCKAFKLYKKKHFDSCYIYAGKELIYTIDKKKRNILNYLQGSSALKKGLLDKALLNFKNMSDVDYYKFIKKVNIGYIYLRKSNYKKALLEYLICEKELNTINSGLMKTLLHNIAVCYIHTKKFKLAEKYFEREISLYKNSDTLNIIKADINIANLYYEQYIDNKAIKMFKKSYELAKVFSNIELKRITSKNMAVVERNRKNYKKSVKYYLEFIKWKDSIWNRDKIWQLTENDKKIAIALKEKEVILKGEELKQQKLISWLIVLVSILIISIIIFLFMFKRKRIKYKNELQKIRITNQERDRISKELHDGVLGKLFGVRFGLGFLEGNTKESNKYKYFLTELKNIEEEIRDVSHKLSIPMNTENKFSLMIKKLVSEKSRQGNFSYKLKISEQILWINIEEEIKNNIYRIIQEVLHNIVKHAKAKKVEIDVNQDSTKLIFEIKDNGIGFNQYEINEGIGIKNIKSRVRKLNGNIKINSKENMGASIYFSISKK